MAKIVGQYEIEMKSGLPQKQKALVKGPFDTIFR